MALGLVAILAPTIMTAQSVKEKKAAKHYEDLAYADAILSYETLVSKGYSEHEVLKKLGNSNYYNARYDEAAKWYGKLMEMETVDVGPNYLYRYVQSLKSLQQYEASDQWMERFKNRFATDSRAAKFDRNKQYLNKIKKQSGNYDIAPAPFNSEVSDFAPSWYGETIVFSSARDSGVATRNIHEWNKGSFLNLYSVAPTDGDSIANTVQFSKRINAKTHESSTAFTNDGTTLYFTRNNSQNGKRFLRDDKGISRLKLMRAELVDGEWTNIVELPFNNAAYSVAHPALNKTNDTLYFASDMPGSYGESDIFMVSILDDGTYGEPVNLGPEINTEARETFPFIDHRGILYFATDGHPGLGGLDIFAVLPKKPDDGVVNLGMPINGTNDDFSFTINSDGKGYFSSNREGGKGADDIYGFMENAPPFFDCTATLVGQTINSETGVVVANAKVVLYGEDNTVLATTESDGNGNYVFDITCQDQKLMLKGWQVDFEEAMRPLHYDGTKDLQKIDLMLKPIQIAHVGDDLKKVLQLKPIYFDLNKSKIRPDAEIELQKIVTYMTEYANVKIAIGSHTDSRGSDAFNLSLSEKRAKSTRAYLISKGINAERLTAKGYGETKLINPCSNGVECEDELHETNRRSEFIVIEE